MEKGSTKPLENCVVNIIPKFQGGIHQTNENCVINIIPKFQGVIHQTNKKYERLINKGNPKYRNPNQIKKKNPQRQTNFSS